MRIGPLEISVGKRRRHAARGYAAATNNRLTSDWVYGPLSANEEIKQGIVTIRERARQLERDNPYIRRWLAMCEQNIVGRGIVFSSKVYDPGIAGRPDKAANFELEENWRKWCADHATEFGLNWTDLLRMAVRTWKRDGEFFARIVRGADNPYRLALRPMESDHCDETYNTVVSRDVRIVMGVEIDAAGRALAYHLKRNHPGDPYAYNQQRVRVPASEVLHLFKPERPGQVRGIAGNLASVMLSVNMLNGYEEAEVVAARTAASKCAFYQIPGGEDWQGETKDDSGPMDDTSPGQIGKLPYGWDIKTVDWQHPNSGFGVFVKSVLRKMANGLGVSYNNFANDLEGVNFSSLRGGTVEERDAWTCDQDFVVDHFCRPLYAAWLEMYLLSGLSKLPFSKYEKFHADSWQPRRWKWVDPYKDLQAAKLAVDMRVASLSGIISEQGEDPEEVWSQSEKDKASLADYGLDYPQPGVPPPIAPEPEDKERDQ